ncbi:MAG: hypothetical protein HRT74_06460 [Flavobacteriales bacterium]|nr:hypothetical protein [Flavobacteriales bacterium]
MKTKTLFISALLTLIAGITNAQSIGGNSPYTFLQIPTSARAASLGGQGIALKDGDIQLGLMNPALVDSTQHHHLGLQYVNYFSGVNMVSLRKETLLVLNKVISMRLTTLSI